MTLHDYVTSARDRLVRAGVRPDEAALDAELLARHSLGWDRARFLSSRRDVAPQEFGARYEPLVARRERREPVPYITGHHEFWGLEFEISRDVLIPRPETELIVEEAIACLSPRTPHSAPRLGSGGPSGPPWLIVDAGTGSGCLAVALAVELPAARIVATDRSRAALASARRNAIRHGVSGRISFVEANYLAAVAGFPDLVVSNPPYVPTPEAPTLPPEVRDHEPGDALFGGADGLDGVRELLRQAEAHLPPGGWLVFEFGAGQEGAVKEAVSRRPRLSLVRIREDLQGIPRTAVVRSAPRPGRSQEHGARSTEHGERRTENGAW